MSWSKLFSNWTWHNKSTAKDTPLSAANLQKINDALDGTDTRATEMFNVMGDEWNSAITYAVGEVVRYKGLLYVCIVANTNVTPTNTIYWGETSVEGEIGSLNSNLAKKCVTYSADWITTSSTAVNTQLTGTITVPKGTYMVIVQTPYSSMTSDALISIKNNSGSTIIIGGYDAQFVKPCYGAGTFVLNFTADTNEIYARTASSSSMTWGNVDRGGIVAVRLS